MRGDAPGAVERLVDGALLGTALREELALERFGPSRDRLRALQRFTVTVSKKDRETWLAAKLAREVQVAAQVAQLVVARREATVVVETSLAHGDDVRVAREVGNACEISVAVARDVRMEAGAGDEPELRRNDERGTR